MIQSDTAMGPQAHADAGLDDSRQAATSRALSVLPGCVGGIGLQPRVTRDTLRHHTGRGVIFEVCCGFIWWQGAGLLLRGVGFKQECVYK